MTFKKSLFIFILVFIFLIITGIYRAQNLFIGGIVDFYLFCLLCFLYFLGFKTKNYWIWINIIFSIIFATFVANAIDQGFDVFSRNVYIYPGFLATIYALIGVITAFLLSKRTYRILGVMLFLISNLFFIYKAKAVFNKWMHYVYFGNFSGEMESSRNYQWTINYRGEIINNRSSAFIDTFIVFDFWNSTCPICIREMPFWDSFASVSNNYPISIIPVFIPSEKENFKTAEVIFSKRKIEYLQPAIGNATMVQNFDVNAYPTLVILKNNKILFKGDKNNAVLWLKTNKLIPF